MTRPGRRCSHLSLATLALALAACQPNAPKEPTEPNEPTDPTVEGDAALDAGTTGYLALHVIRHRQLALR